MKREILNIALAGLLILGAGVAWINWYVVPHDAMMHRTWQCVEAEMADDADANPKALWGPCWDHSAQVQDWAWSRYTTKPKKQGE